MSVSLCGVFMVSQQCLVPVALSLTTTRGFSYVNRDKTFDDFGQDKKKIKQTGSAKV